MPPSFSEGLVVRMSLVPGKFGRNPLPEGNANQCASHEHQNTPPSRTKKICHSLVLLLLETISMYAPSPTGISQSESGIDRVQGDKSHVDDLYGRIQDRNRRNLRRWIRATQSQFHGSDCRHRTLQKDRRNHLRHLLTGWSVVSDQVPRSQVFHASPHRASVMSLVGGFSSFD